MHQNKQEHLQLSQLPKGSMVPINSIKNIPCDYVFSFSIMHFMIDINESVIKPKGYLEKLKTDINLQNKFELAIDNIFDPLN